MRTGLNLKKELLDSSPKDYIFGAVRLPDLASNIPKEHREHYLPQGELQFGVEDFMDCVTRGFNNIIEYKMNYVITQKLISPENIEWLKLKGYITDKGFEASDRFIAILSDTTRSGNSLKSVIEALRKNGVIPKSMLSANATMTFDQYHNEKDITQKMLDLGQEFLERIKINYEKVYVDKFKSLIESDVLNVAGYAWETTDGKTYGRLEYDPNHDFTIYNPLYKAFDNYKDWDNDFIKDLTSDYKFMPYGYRVVINETKVAPKLAICDIIKEWMTKIFRR